MGIGGQNHEGANLTDAIMVVSIQPSTKRVAVLSVPRDLYVAIPDYGQGKINTAYALWAINDPQKGINLLRSIAEEIFGIPIHYYARADFRGFEKIINAVGGVTINVENTLDDPYYPVPGKEMAPESERYEQLVIEKGIRYMNGETALKFVRSRMAKGTEGNDFARSRRQYKLIMAVKEKLLSPGTYINIYTLNKIVGSVRENFNTDLEIWQMLRIYDMVKDINPVDISQVVLDDSPQSPLVAATSTDAYILKPRTGDWSELRKIALNIFNPEIVAGLIKARAIARLPHPAEAESSDHKENILADQKRKNYLEIDNGTKITGLARRTAQYLEQKGFRVAAAANSPLQTYKKTLVYDLDLKTSDERKELIKELEGIFKAIVFTSGPPQNPLGGSLKYPVDKNAKVLIILGEDWLASSKNLQ